MIDREKVIKGLETCIWFGIGMVYDCTGCPYDTKELETKCITEMQEDVIKLLKEQEAVVRCKECTQNNQCSIQFKFADADNPGEWFCAYGKRR